MQLRFDALKRGFKGLIALERLAFVAYVAVRLHLSILNVMFHIAHENHYERALVIASALSSLRAERSNLYNFSTALLLRSIACLKTLQTVKQIASLRSQ